MGTILTKVIVEDWLQPRSVSCNWEQSGITTWSICLRQLSTIPDSAHLNPLDYYLFFTTQVTHLHFLTWNHMILISCLVTMWNKLFKSDFLRSGMTYDCIFCLLHYNNTQQFLIIVNLTSWVFWIYHILLLTFFGTLFVDL